MGLHKLTAGDGYLYLIRQVAASDATERGRPTLAQYYTEKGESPGRWMGRGLAALATPAARYACDPLVAKYWGVQAGSQVGEEQMKALFGEGLHPNAEQITGLLTKLGAGAAGASMAARLGRPFHVDGKENRFVTRLREVYRDYNLTIGADVSASIDPDIRARLRTAVGQELFTETYARPPADARELSGFIAANSRAASTAVAGYDLTFTPVKSVSTLWAIGAPPIAAAIEDCHHQAVEETLQFLEDNAAFSRMGAGGIAQVDTTGLIVAAFDHRDSRAGDPNLHTHAAVSNKVHVIGPDGIGRWMALDGATLHRAAVAASEFYNTRIEALLVEKLRVRFTARQSRRGKRPVREIDGIPEELNEKYSSRSAAIDHRVGELAKGFHTEHGREPTAVEMLALTQQATLETRQAKHEPRCPAEQRHTWRVQAVEVLGSQRALSNMVAAVTNHAPAHHVPISDSWVHQQAAHVIDTVSEHRATWTINHVRAEAHRQLRYADHPGGPELVNRIVTAALRGHSLVLTSHADTDKHEPAALRRADGSSVYTRHDTTLHTSEAILAAERRILAAAARTDGRVIDADSIGLALLEAHANTGLSLNDGQIAMVREMATSGARVQLALAPAGTGKTTAMAALAAAWRTSGGTVIGLAPTAGAAEVLAEDLGSFTDTIAKLVQLTGTRADQPQAPHDDPARRWFDTINADSLLIVDEAGMASTADLDTLITHALARGASVRLIGDDQQLASISAGGVLADLADRYNAVTLSTVVRFTHPETGKAEAAASLAIRAGDPAGIGFYIDHHRVHVGADQHAADMAYEAWAADRAAGRDSILLAPTNELVAQLNERARLDRLTAAGTAASAPSASATVTLADGLTASAGDTIATRKNARWIPTSRGCWVKNGHRWTIRTVHNDGSLTVVPLRGTATPVRLPAHYVTTNTTLGYACTINAAQGMTAGGRAIEGTCHTVISDRLTRQQFYVAGTRGCTENHFYGSTAESDPHRILAPKATHPPTAVDVLAAILARDGAQQSAHTIVAADADPFTRLHRAAAMYADALSTGAEHRAGTTVMTAIDSAAAALGTRVTDAPAWPVLRRNLALLALGGTDPVAALHDAAATPLGDAVDPAAVLDWRLPICGESTAPQPAPLHWLNPTPAALSNDDVWGPYLAARAELVTELADAVRTTARGWGAATAPAWARPLLGQRNRLMAEIAVFRAAHGVDQADTRITGPEQHPNRSKVFQDLIHARLDAALTRANTDAARWRQLAENHDRNITADPFWPRLATHLNDAAQAGADIDTLLRDALAAHGPLPSEMPAAALWWRLAGTLAPPSLDRADTTLRPAWAPQLHALFGTVVAEAILTDHAWPSLVAAVAASDWPPADLLAAAAEHLHDINAEKPLRPDQYARLLTYRVELLTHHAATLDPDIPHPAEAPHNPAVGDHLDLDNAAGDYSHNEDLAEPPPDPHDYPYSFAEEDLAGLDFDDLPHHRPPGAARAEHTDIPALRARRDTAYRRVRELEKAILGGGGGPAEHAAAAELAELRRRHHQQRPLHEALAHAHTRWVHAEDAAALHATLLDQLDAVITAATGRADDGTAARYRAHRDQVTGNTERITVALHTARARLDDARTALLDAAGGQSGIVTEHHIHTRRAEAITADTATLNDARRNARTLDDQLCRAEASAARALAQRPTHAYDLAADLDALRAEVAFLQAASTVSPAALYYPPETAVADLDDTHRRVITAITANIHTVQALHLHPGADKHGALAALVATAHHQEHGVLALTATPATRDYAAQHPYADATGHIDSARTTLGNQPLKLPLGSLIVVDDADHLSTDNLHWLTNAAAATNTKLILITTGDHHHRPARTLIAALHHNSTAAHQLGTPEPDPTPVPRTAIERAEHHLATTSATSTTRDQAVELLRQRTQIVDRLRDIADAAAHIDNLTTPDRHIDRGYGIEL
ncbi:MobF family relaxase [Mycobacterium paragordonae]|uniref:MobF family relaxase n=1 Tax=Mycobacterium paragordonae TaxID=1389713 RepID=A0AAJ1SHY1_9MYCO|nr:MobF family relaxase [Mycobacterium paragordonae]MDP7739524.1 MobF family relaxase [Mycobacterium paragordonae]